MPDISDIDFDKLYNELKLLPACLKDVCPQVKTVTSIQTVTDYMNEAGMKQAFSQFHKLLRLYLTIPICQMQHRRGHFLPFGGSRTICEPD